MRIYAIKDRLIDYWGQPFAGPDHKAVMQAIARTVNTGDATSDIAQNAHHFEIWQLGIVTEDGHITPEREFVCDASSLVRERIRENAGERARADAAQEATRAQHSAARGPTGNGGAQRGSVQVGAQATTGEGEEIPRGHRGGYPPPNLQTD